jgi:hypothetical protein
MSKFIGIIIGGLAIAGGVLMEIASYGLNQYGYYLIASGAAVVIGNVGTLLSQPQGGLGTASRNPVMPWNVVYGRAKVGGTIVYINSFGDNDKYLDMVFVLASHQCMAVDALCFDNKRIPIDPTTSCSYTPTQQTINITSIVRAYGVVTVTTSGAIGDLQPGDQVQIQNVTGVTSIDRSLNGVVYVYEVISTTEFTYLSGGLDISLGTTGQVRTLWPDYRSKVYCETLLGDQIATFNGMLNGTPYDGDTGDLIQPGGSGGPNPWTDQHILNGKTCAMLRLHYNDEVFSSGIPQISWRIRGKKDIYDPRNGTAVAAATVLLNGWGPNAHEGPYEGGVDLGYTWGTDGSTTGPYGIPDLAIDGNPSTASIISARHTHQYFGCVWTFPATTGATYLSVLSEVPTSGPGSLRSAGIYYSLDSGSTWTKVYDQAVRAEQWDNISLPGGQDTSQVQVMAFMDSHDDMTHHVYEIQVGSGPASGVNGYTENAALCAADYLANTVWGFKATYGDEIPLTPLITAANICDEPVPLADGSTEPRYTCNGNFQLSASRGEILQNMLTACGGRVTYSSGQFIIHPAYWPGTTVYLGEKRPSNVVFKITTSHILGVSAGASGVITLNLAPYDAATNPIGLWTQSDLFCVDNTAWTNRVNSSTLAYDPATNLVTITATGAYSGGSRTCSLHDLCITVYSQSTLFGSSTPGDIMEVFDCELDLTYPDSSTAVMKPTQAIIIPEPGAGTVTNPGNAVDGNATTYAKVERNSFSSLGNAPGIQVTGFELVSAGPGVPDLTPAGILGSVPLLGMTAGPFTWRSKLPIRELYNGCKGMFISPANGWQNSDFPPYAQDADHGYSGPADFEGDQNLADDGGDRRWLEIQLPFTISPFAAQRLAKIELMRKRQQGTGTFAFNMSLYQVTALDIVAFTLPMLGWSAKLMEISAHRLLLNKSDTGTTIGCELDLQETDPSVYEWSVTEQLAPQGPGYGVMPNTQQVAAVAGVTAISGSTTTVTGADGISRSQILVQWSAPTDGFVVNGGHIEVQYQLATSPPGAWTALPTVNSSVTQAYIGGVTNGQTYNVQVRAVNAAGAPGSWTTAAPVTVSGTATSMPPSYIAQAGATTGQVLTWTGSPPGWKPTTPATTGGGGGIVGEAPAGTLNGTNTVFTLSTAPNPANSLILFLNGIEQKTGTDYTLSGGTITYAVAPIATDWQYAYYSTSGATAGGSPMGVVGITIDGGGSVPSTGLKGSVALPFGFTLTGWTAEATDGTTGSVSVDIWAAAGSPPPAVPPVPTAANKISALAPVSISSAQSASGGTSAISTWTTALPQYTQVSFYLSSITTCTRVTIALIGTKS